MAGEKLLCGLAARDTLLDVELQDVVEAVEGSAQRNAPGELDDLRLREMRAQARKHLVAGLVPVIGDGDRILDDEFVDSIEFGMISIVEQPRGPLLRDALDRQLRRMVRHAV